MLSGRTIRGYYDDYKSIEDQKKWAEGETIFSRAVREYPEEVGFYTILNRCLREQKKNRQALEQITKTYEQYPDNEYVRDSYMYSLLGYAWHLNDHDKKTEAFVLFEKAFNMDPENEWNINGYGYILKEQGRLSDSIAVLEKGLKKYEKNEYIRVGLSWAYYARANLYRDTGEPEKAENFYNQALALNDDQWINLNYGIHLRKKKDYQSALKIFEKGQAKFISNQYFTTNLIITYYEFERDLKDKGHGDRAIAVSRKAAGIFPDEPWFKTDLSDYFMEKGDYVRSAEYIIRSAKVKNRTSIEKKSGIDLVNNMFNRMKELVFKLSSEEKFKEGFNLINNIDQYFPGHYSYPALKGELLYHSGEKEKGLDLVYKAYDIYIKEYPQHEKSVVIKIPLKGMFLVYGNSRRDTITHAGMNRFCFDFMGCNEKGEIKKNDQADLGTNEEYYGFGLSIFSPVDGIVERVVDDKKDLAPSREYRLWDGNMISIRDKDGLHYYFAHHKFHSARVQAGEKVKAGQIIAELGNTGMTTIPHLHFGIYSADWVVSLPVQFTDYRFVGKDGSIKQIKKGVPQTEQIILVE